VPNLSAAESKPEPASKENSTPPGAKSKE